MNIDYIFKETMQLVKECSAIIEEKYNEVDKRVKEKDDGSLVTEYDIIVDNKLTEGLKQIINIPVLSEEHEENIEKTYFIIDPIDGTHNFNIGYECFGIMVALVNNKQTIFSIIELPKMRKTFWAINGKRCIFKRK